MSKTVSFAVSLFLAFAVAGPALAEDWTGQTPPPQVTGSIGPTDAGVLQKQQYLVYCAPAYTPAPCTPGQTPVYQGSGIFNEIPALPAAAGPGSNLGVFFAGAYVDPTSPSGLSAVGGNIPLEAFARSATVSALSSTVGTLNTSLNALNTTVGSLSTSFTTLSGTVSTLGTSVNALAVSMGTISTQLQSLSIQFNQFQQQVTLQDRTMRRGVAMSLAMDGVGDLGPDEKFAISTNLGTFGGQNGMAAGVAFRAAEHLTFNAGIGTGLRGGLVGGRAGVRMAW